MLRFALCSVFLLTLFTPTVLSIPQKRNYKRMEITGIDVVKVGEELDEKTSFEIKEMKDGGAKGVGIMKFKKDLPRTATVQWILSFVGGDNQVKKQTEGSPSTLCDFMTKEKPMADMMLNNSNLTSCVVKQGTYVFRKCAPNPDVFPQKIPEKRNSWILDIIISQVKRVILHLRVNTDIER